MKITGKIKDPSSRPIPDAKVQVLDRGTEIAGIQSASDGSFEFSAETTHPNHVWEVLVAKDRFQTTRRAVRAEGEDDLLITLQPLHTPFVWPNWATVLIGVVLVLGMVLWRFLPGGLRSGADRPYAAQTSGDKSGQGAGSNSSRPGGQGHESGTQEPVTQTTFAGSIAETQVSSVTIPETPDSNGLAGTSQSTSPADPSTLSASAGTPVPKVRGLPLVQAVSNLLAAGFKVEPDAEADAKLIQRRLVSLEAMHGESDSTNQVNLARIQLLNRRLDRLPLFEKFSRPRLEKELSDILYGHKQWTNQFDTIKKSRDKWQSILVKSQDPAPGKPVPPGGTVKLRWTMPPTTTVPPLVGRTIQYANEKLDSPRILQVLLRPSGIPDLPRDIPAAARISRQNPAPDEIVDTGSAVWLWIDLPK
jgi:hypothetical protein